MGFLERVLPYQPVPEHNTQERQLKPVKTEDTKKMGKLMRAASFALGLTSSYGVRGLIDSGSYESAPYDFDRITAAVDTDSYVKQGFSKYQELMWKEGYELVGQNQDAIEYILHRFYYMEQVMGMPIIEMFKTVSDQLCKFHNAVVAKVRNEKFATVYPGVLNPLSESGPIVGYEVIPVETVRIERDSHNKAKRYKQNLCGYGGPGEPKSPVWDVSEIIHLTQDRKPGYIFGTPFMTAVIEDVIALRTMEEDVQNLVHQELFPIVDVTVGTEEFPGDDDEVISAAQEIANMRHDGALIHTERRKIAIIGSEGNALDATPYLNAVQQRVAMGLGLYPHHLGMTFAGGNRSMTQQLDIALYDRIKMYQRYIASMISMTIINELLREGGFDPSNKNDKCYFRFREIDTDTRIKKENQVVQLVNSNLITISEARLRIGETSDLDEDDTLAALKYRMSPAQSSTTPDIDADGKQEPSSGGAPNPKNDMRAIDNKMRPRNQYGRLLSPNVKHDDSITWVKEAVDLLGEEELE